MPIDITQDELRLPGARSFSRVSGAPTVHANRRRLNNSWSQCRLLSRKHTSDRYRWRCFADIPRWGPPQDRFYVRNKPVRPREQMAHHLGLGQAFLDKPPVLLLWEEYHKGASWVMSIGTFGLVISYFTLEPSRILTCDLRIRGLYKYLYLSYFWLCGIFIVIPFGRSWPRHFMWTCWQINLGWHIFYAKNFLIPVKFMTICQNPKQISVQK